MAAAMALGIVTGNARKRRGPPTAVAGYAPQSKYLGATVSDFVRNVRFVLMAR